MIPKNVKQRNVCKSDAPVMLELTEFHMQNFIVFFSVLIHSVH